MAGLLRGHQRRDLRRPRRPRGDRTRGCRWSAHNAEFVCRIPDLIREAGGNPRQAVGMVFADPNGADVPLPQLAWLAGQCPRLDLAIHWNSAIVKRCNGLDPARYPTHAKTPLDQAIAGLGKDHWLIRTPLGNWQFTVSSSGGTFGSARTGTPVTTGSRIRAGAGTSSGSAHSRRRIAAIGIRENSSNGTADVGPGSAHAGRGGGFGAGCGADRPAWYVRAGAAALKAPGAAALSVGRDVRGSCQERWGWTKTHSNRMIGSVSVVEKIWHPWVPFAGE